MSEDKQSTEDSKSKMLAALAKKQKEIPVVKVLAQPLDQRLVLVKLAAVRQRCIDANLALPKRHI